MKSITFSQALVAVGLVGLTLPLTVGQTNILYINAAYAYEGGPSPVGPIVALAATLAIAIVILITGLARVRAVEAEAPLTHRQLLVTLGLLGLLLAGAFSPTSLVFSIVTGWDERSWWTSVDAGPLALQLGAFAIPLLVIVRNLIGARQGPSLESEGIAGLLTNLTVLDASNRRRRRPGRRHTTSPPPGLLRQVWRRWSWRPLHCRAGNGHGA